LIEEKRSDWKIAQTMAEASKLANVGEDFQSKLLKDTAVNTIQDGLNLAFSELDTALLDENNSTPTPVQVTSAPAAVAQLAPTSPPNTLDLGFESDSIVDVEAVPATPKRAARRNS
jgi:hypothetical protein